MQRPEIMYMLARLFHSVTAQLPSKALVKLNAAAGSIDCLRDSGQDNYP